MKRGLYLHHTWKRKPKLLGAVLFQGWHNSTGSAKFTLAMGHQLHEYNLFHALRRALSTQSMRTFTLHTTRRKKFVAIITNLQRRGDAVNVVLRIIGEAP